VSIGVANRGGLRSGEVSACLQLGSKAKKAFRPVGKRRCDSVNGLEAGGQANLKLKLKSAKLLRKACVTYVLPVGIRMLDAYGDPVGTERHKVKVKWPKNAAVSNKPLKCGSGRMP